MVSRQITTYSTVVTTTQSLWTHHFNALVQFLCRDGLVELQRLIHRDEYEHLEKEQHDVVQIDIQSHTCCWPLVLSGASMIIGSRTQIHEKFQMLCLRHSLNVDSPWRMQ